ncbi:MAG: Rrf2 family transcriptional regulator [Spirochaetales bacterium]|jgi:Rrf2 family protein|nr:Rrf2 family transcriptional regulator [Spirochaetales bacterium]
MKISTRGQYGLQLLVDLTEHASESHVTLASVGQRQDISVRYLEQVAVILRRSGFIRSVKGASGGYALARPAEEIMMKDVLQCLEGDLLVAEPLPPGVQENRLRMCLRRMVYDKLDLCIAGVIGKYTLAALAASPNADRDFMYFI